MTPSSRGLRTIAVHGGEAPDPHSGASAPNLVLSTTFVMDDEVPFSALELPDDPPFVYSRWGNPTVAMLEEKLAALEGAESCRCFGSGMAASAAVLLSLLSAGDHLVISEVNYPGTAELARDTLPRFGISVTPVDTSDLDAVAAAITPATKLVWVETPANPILRLTDIAAVAELAHATGAQLAVDSTFATPIATRPIALGADYVVHSLTKYIGGHGDAVGGAVIGSRADLARMSTEATVHYGGVLSPFNAWLIARGAATLPLRMRAHQDGATAVAAWLEGDLRVTRVLYPGLASHPQHDLATRQMANFSGVVSFQVAGDGRRTAARLRETLEVIHYAVSLGHHRSLIYWMPSDDLIASSYRLTGAALDAYRAVAGDGVFRLSVGLEDPADLIADLDRVL